MSWTPGCGVPHPQAALIMEWSLGKTKLEQQRVITGPILVEPPQAFGAWIPVNFPVFNPETWRFRVKQGEAKYMAVALAGGTDNQVLVTVSKEEVRDWDQRNPGLERITEWTEITFRPTAKIQAAT